MFSHFKFTTYVSHVKTGICWSFNIVEDIPERFVTLTNQTVYCNTGFMCVFCTCSQSPQNWKGAYRQFRTQLAAQLPPNIKQQL